MATHPFVEGLKAFRSGRLSTDNPFPDPEGHRHWEEGWRTGAEDQGIAAGEQPVDVMEPDGLRQARSSAKPGRDQAAFMLFGYAFGFAVFLLFVMVICAVLRVGLDVDVPLYMQVLVALGVALIAAPASRRRRRSRLAQSGTPRD